MNDFLIWFAVASFALPVVGLAVEIVNSWRMR